jgi:hypothetical protein
MPLIALGRGGVRASQQRPLWRGVVTKLERNAVSNSPSPNGLSRWQKPSVLDGGWLNRGGRQVFHAIPDFCYSSFGASLVFGPAR